MDFLTHIAIAGETDPLMIGAEAQYVIMEDSTSVEETIQDIKESIVDLGDAANKDVDDVIDLANPSTKLPTSQAVANIRSSWYGVCNSAASVADKKVAIPNFPETISPATIVNIKFTNTNTATAPTLNISNTGAKDIYYDNKVIDDTNIIYAGAKDKVIQYMYDGTNWVFTGWSTASSSSTVLFRTVEPSQSPSAQTVSLVITDPAITSTARCDIYTNVFGTVPKSVTQQNTTLTIVFNNPSSAFDVKVVVSEDTV